jgi:predicted ATPase/DNA-binding winged helix-turn-helix (wHTH) protein
MDEEIFAFGSLRLIPAQRMLSEDGKPLRLGSRALDILVALIERAGETIPKEELIARVWPDTVVEEAALRVHVAALRKALGDGRAGTRYITNLSGRGYAFIAPVTRENMPSATAAPTGTAETGNLPAPLTRIIGRDEVISRLAQQLVRRRFLTIVGPGGIGKTTVAVAVADVAHVSYSDGTWYVELASLSDPDLVPSAFCTLLGITLSGVNRLSGLTAWLRDKRILIVLDNCEHVIGAAAALAEAILKAAPHAGILATSREPLRAEGEWLHRLAPLELPPQARSSPTAAEALGYSAVELFNERATATTDSFMFDDADVPAVLEICHPDGVPLALELAAARVDAFGVGGLAARVDDRFAVLTSGRRTALPRQQTLRAMLDWSYDLLSEPERMLLRRVAIFVGPFGLEAAEAVVESRELGSLDAVEGLFNLVSKSLVVSVGEEGVTRFRLLETIRAYAIEKLILAGELTTTARRHAEYHSDLFHRARSDWESQPTAAWLAEYGYRLDDLRTTLDWAFSTNGNVALGIELVVDAVPLWMQRSLTAECRRRVEQALAHITAETAENARLRMRLSTARSLSRMYTGDPLSEIDESWSATLDLAEEVGDPDYQLRALWGLFACSFNRSAFRRALELGERFRDVATGPNERLIGERLIGTALHMLGDQQGARRHIEHMLAGYVPPATSSHIIRYQNEQRIAARRVLAPVLWLQGYPDQAMRMVENAVVNALQVDHVLSLCNLLAQAACPLAFLTGDLDAARRFTAILVERAALHSLEMWSAYGRCFDGQLMTREGQLANGLSRMRGAGADLRRAGFLQYYTPYLGSLAEALGVSGQIAPGLVAIGEAIERAESTGEHWCLAELLRIKAELLLLQGARDAAATAEDHFRQALDLARRQGALAWELRAATNLARLLRDRDHSAEAMGILQPVYDRFTEGFDTADLKTAKVLLVDLRSEGPPNSSAIWDTA